MNILIIDDEDEVRKLIRLILEKGHHRIFEAENGRIGMDQCEMWPIDLVITDLFMPDKEGLETIRDLRRKYPHVRIIAISGGTSQGNMDYLKSARMFGADATIAKPFEPEALYALVETIGSN